MEKKPEQEKPKDREKLADEVLEILSDSPDEMGSLVELLKKLEENPVLHPKKVEGKKPDKKKEP